MAEALATETRFAFGENWLDLLPLIDDQRVQTAEDALRAAVRRDTLSGLSFLDAGSGTGLFSLAALRLGAARVHSFDSDPESVRCTEELRRRYAPDSERWTIEAGDLTDAGYCESLGGFDAVYCFGALHHTGAMWQAMDNLVDTVVPGGIAYLSVYNHQGHASGRWRRIKRFYHRLPEPVRPLYAALVWLPFEAREAAFGAMHNRSEYRRTWTHRNRGMSKWHDIVDWVGGYPFETATPDDVFERCRAHGLELIGLKTVGGSLACNEFLFRRPVPAASE